jgi:DegV family protein with EDD domain
MTIKIVTDTGSDLSPADAKEMGITLVPLYVSFGDKVYRDGVDIGTDDFYQKLEETRIQPFTSSPSPGDFARVYREMSKDTDQIISIHITKKHSSTLDSARLGKEMVESNGCHVEVVDSLGVTMWQGTVAMAAARAVQSGCSLQQVKERIQETINQMHGIGLLNTLRYIVKGGRLRDSIFKVENVISVKPMITLRDGEIKPLGLARNWNKGLERIQEFIRAVPAPQNVAIIHNTVPSDAQNIIDNLRAALPNAMLKLSRLGPALGVHSGPGALLATVQQGNTA